MSEINGAAPAPKVDPTIIQALEQSLARAKAGKLIGVLIINVPSDGQNDTVAGGRGLMEMYSGAGLAMRRIEAAMSNAAQRQMPSIVPARNLPPGFAP